MACPSCGGAGYHGVYCPALYAQSPLNSQQQWLGGIGISSTSFPDGQARLCRIQRAAENLLQIWDSFNESQGDWMVRMNDAIDEIRRELCLNTSAT